MLAEAKYILLVEDLSLLQLEIVYALHMVEGGYQCRHVIDCINDLTETEIPTIIKV